LFGQANYSRAPLFQGAEKVQESASVPTISADSDAYDSFLSARLSDPPVKPRHSTGARLSMNVTLKPFDFAQAVARAGLTTDGQPVAKAKSPAVEGGGFQGALTDALKSVSKSQDDVVEMQRQVQLGNSSVSLEETMVAMQKAQLGFQASLQVRNKLVQAYTDIMNMQV
jgi:flagellar hook-basal body complex protein FliE